MLKTLGHPSVEWVLQQHQILYCSITNVYCFDISFSLSSCNLSRSYIASTFPFQKLSGKQLISSNTVFDAIYESLATNVVIQYFFFVFYKIGRALNWGALYNHVKLCKVWRSTLEEPRFVLAFSYYYSLVWKLCEWSPLAFNDSKPAWICPDMCVCSVVSSRGLINFGLKIYFVLWGVLYVRTRSQLKTYIQ